MKHVIWFAVGIGLCMSVSTAYAVLISVLPIGAGTYAQWIPSTGSTHYALVDETTCNGVTDYVRTVTPGHRDSFAVSLAGIPDGSLITRIDVKPCASRQTGGGAAPIMKLFYRLNGVNSSDAGSYSLSGTTPTELATTSWTGLSMTKTSTTTLETGALLFSGTKGARLSRLATLIEYTPLPAPPGNLQSTWTNSSNYNIQLTWTDLSSNETGFRIERSTDNVNFSLIGTTTASTTSAVNTVLGAGTYYYRITSYNIAGASEFGTTSSVTVATPNTPSGLTILGQTLSTVTLQWTDTSTTEQSFRIERSTDGTNFALLATTSQNSTQYIDSTVTQGQTYYYRIASVNIVGMSAYGASIPHTPLSVPNTPSAMTATLVSSSTAHIALNWIDNASDELGFQLERAFNSTTSFALITSPSMNTMSWTDFSSASTAGTWHYRVRAYNLMGESEYSNIATVVVP